MRLVLTLYDASINSNSYDQVWVENRVFKIYLAHCGGVFNCIYIYTVEGIPNEHLLVTSSIIDYSFTGV